ncbi:hypothetical protein IQ241_09245 [Romeria aff. gracilis LEGE 07310]|uniref:Uncharacterized protein n=1 Tax=Vasconcelosia minhoensis LEGE 07310 TaxID=915328 RepID=A0A8J7DLR0_9CYAN|nr:hypothetical protein [Romeria gracilis]MBE9077481.1 hypothetical protein [Romeria aff. gracilis LEGE 07310]
MTGLLGGAFQPLAGIAQTSLPSCPPPATAEYLLLIRGEDAADRDRIVSVLPQENPVLICEYAGEVIVRAGGFTQLETANAWATYMDDIEGYEAFVSVEPGQAEPIAYQPQPLRSGYAVLVDYDHSLATVAAVERLIDQPVGLAAYQQRPYLLIEHTEDAVTAVEQLEQLSQANFIAVLVDGEQVVRLTEAIAAIATEPE